VLEADLRLAEIAMADSVMNGALARVDPYPFKSM
jgi:hypothetical protein